MTKAELIKDLELAADHEEIVIVMEDNPKNDDPDPDVWDELEPGSVLEISEAGGYVRGMRVIRAYPRG